MYEAAWRREGFVNLLSDPGFKAVFCDRNNKSLLIHLLNCLLPEGVRVRDIVSYLDREQSIDYLGGKKTILDLVCKGDGGELFNVEVQSELDREFFERCVYYGSGLYHEQLLSGDDYQKLRPVYIIALLGFNIDHSDESQWDTDNIVSRYTMVETRTGEFAPSTIIVIFAELARFTKEIGDCLGTEDKLFYWFKNGWRYKEEPNQLEDEEFLGDLVRACNVASFTKDKYDNYIVGMKSQRDALHRERQIRREGLEEGLEKGREEGLQQGLTQGREEGLQKGLEKGLEEGSRQKSLSIALALKQRGFELAQIAEITGLSPEEVSTL